MTEIDYYEIEGEQSTSSANIWEDKLVRSGFVKAGDYIVFGIGELKGALTNKFIACRMLVILEGGGEYTVNETQFVPNNVNNWGQFIAFRKHNLPEGTHTLKIQLKGETASQIATIRRARVRLLKY